MKPLSIIISLICCFAVYSQGQLTVIPEPYDRALKNPMMGFSPNNLGNHPWGTLSTFKFPWTVLEEHESDGIDKILAASDQMWGDAAERNMKVIPHIYLHWVGAEETKHWPSDMVEDDYTSEQFQQRVVRLIERIGICWDNDPRIAFVEMAIFGKWGEQHSPSPTPEMQKIVGDAFAKAFKNKKVSVRHHWKEFTDHPFGVYWASYAHYDQMWGHGKSIQNLNSTEDRYLHNYVGAEVAFDWGNTAIQPGTSPTNSVSIEKHRNFVINSIRWLHGTHLRWIDRYDQNDPVAVAGAEEIQKVFGYRYVLNEVRVSMDDSLSVSFDVTNEGSAPFYYDWPVEVALLDATTLEPVWKSVMESVDIRSWHPGSGWTEPEWTHVGDWREYVPHENWNSTGITGWANPPQKSTVSEKFGVDVPEGNYVLSLAVLDPAGMLPSLRFATANYINGGRHPIANVNTATNECTALPTDFPFDDMFSDNSLYYDPTFYPFAVYTITTHANNGTITIDPVKEKYDENEEVTLIAVPATGYIFTGWDGALSGAENPITMVVDEDINVIANFEVYTGPLYSLSTTAQNGTITLYPDGGSYAPETVVTVTAVPNTGYIFTGWSGDLDGKSITTIITMDSNKGVTANFAKAYGINLGAEDGTTYTASDGMVYTGLRTSWTANNSGNVVEGTNDPGLFTTWTVVPRNPDFNRSFSIPVENGTYQVTLMTSEHDSYYAQSGKRVTEISYEGSLYHPAFDTWDAIGAMNTALEIVDIVTVNDGELNVRLRKVADVWDDVPIFHAFKAVRIDDEHNVFTLVKDAENGIIRTNPVGDSFYEGMEITLTAIPEDGYEFIGWSGDLTGTDNPASITMDGNKEVIAEFTVITGLNNQFNNVSSQNKLGQNYPNPFSINTVIPYYLSGSDHVRLTVYNFTGQQIVVLVNEFQSRGRYSYNWEARDNNGNPLGKGLYLYRLETSNGIIQTEKLMIK